MFKHSLFLFFLSRVLGIPAVVGSNSVSVGNFSVSLFATKVTFCRVITITII